MNFVSRESQETDCSLAYIVDTHRRQEKVYTCAKHPVQSSE